MSEWCFKHKLRTKSHTSWKWLKCSHSYLGFRQCQGQAKNQFKNVGCLLSTKIDVRNVHFDILNKKYNSSKIRFQDANMVVKSEAKLKLFIYNESI